MKLIYIALLALLLTGCSGGPGAPAPNLAGTWNMQFGQETGKWFLSGGTNGLYVVTFVAADSTPATIQQSGNTVTYAKLINGLNYTETSQGSGTVDGDHMTMHLVVTNVTDGLDPVVETYDGFGDRE